MGSSQSSNVENSQDLVNSSELKNNYSESSEDLLEETKNLKKNIKKSMKRNDFCQVVKLIMESKSIDSHLICKYALIPCYESKNLFPFLERLEEYEEMNPGTYDRMWDIVQGIQNYLNENRYFECLLEICQLIHDYYGTMGTLMILYRYQVNTVQDLKNNSKYLIEMMKTFPKMEDRPQLQRLKQDTFFQMELVVRMSHFNHWEEQGVTSLISSLISHWNSESNNNSPLKYNPNPEQCPPMTIFDRDSDLWISVASLIASCDNAKGTLKLDLYKRYLQLHSKNDKHSIAFSNEVEKVFSITLELLIHLKYDRVLFDIIPVFVNILVRLNKDIDLYPVFLPAINTVWKSYPDSSVVINKITQLMKISDKRNTSNQINIKKKLAALNFIGL